ncbi:cytochrome P450 3A24-like [Oppia nitens]|uniref:cytochrome P450 3A24-like n=1 Tax=Oppia nitens TaxID=1686743 RepID=UPI0023DBA075|nr:cytochrome P450 3A24-like [Oppia nitens]
MTKMLFEWELDLYTKYGKLFGVYESTRPVLYLAEPDLIRDILVKDFHNFINRRDLTTGSDPLGDNMVTLIKDDKWKRVRTVMSTTFTTGKLKKMIPLINECLQTMDKNFNTISLGKTGSDVKTVFGTYSMEVIIQVAFGTKVDALYDKNNPIIENAKKFFRRKFDYQYFLFIFAPYLAKYFNLTLFDKNASKFFSDFTLKIIEDRRSRTQLTDIKRNDFLQLMLESIENSDINNDKENEDINENLIDREKYRELKSTEKFEKYLTNDEFIAQCVLFFIAGYEGNATTLSMVTYLLAKYPECQQKLYEEVDHYFKHHNQTDVDYDVLHSLKYLNAIIDETLRLYPIALFLEREANDDYKLGETGITIKKGGIVHIPTFAIHRDPENFTDPEVFKPERFMASNVEHHPYAYLPFGAGPRNCIGMRLAQMVIKLALVSAVHKYKFHDTGKPIKFYDNVGSMTTKNMFLKVEKRLQNAN